ncbi:hypothetical protein J3R83DRAFT_12744 [Lanmaoa asiatica]|nr:hypothetical protein J3R83DRAFT_12744 [Lanmaoa asiatica]
MLFSDGNLPLTAFLLLLTFGQLGLGIAFTVKRCQVSHIFRYSIRAEYAYLPFSYGFLALPAPENIRVLGLISLGAGALNDIGVAASLCYYLQTMRSSYAQTNSLIRNLTLNAVNTGALTRYCWTSTMLFSIWLTPLSSALSCFTMIMVSIACSLVLNTRQIIRGRGTECDAKRFSMATDQRRYSHSVPLHSPTVFGDPLDVEFHGGEDKGVSAPGLGKGLVVPRPPDSGSTAQGDNPNIIFTQDRPDNTAGW